MPIVPADRLVVLQAIITLWVVARRTVERAERERPAQVPGLKTTTPP